jgi:hypothetical protein
VVGYEALTRFQAGLAPSQVFTTAARVGLETELELACLAAAIAEAPRLARQEGWLSLNASPGLVLTEGLRLGELLAGADRAIVIEVTEHAVVDSYGDLREALAQIDRQVLQLFAMVGENVCGATHALLSGDREEAKSLADRDQVVDSLYREIERHSMDQLTTGGITAPEDLHFLVTIIRMLPDFERIGDLAEHVARRAARGLGTELTPRSRGLVDGHDGFGRADRPEVDGRPDHGGRRTAGDHRHQPDQPHRHSDDQAADCRGQRAGGHNRIRKLLTKKNCTASRSDRPNKLRFLENFERNPLREVPFLS